MTATTSDVTVYSGFVLFVTHSLSYSCKISRAVFTDLDKVAEKGDPKSHMIGLPNSLELRPADCYRTAFRRSYRKISTVN